MGVLRAVPAKWWSGDLIASEDDVQVAYLPKLRRKEAIFDVHGTAYLARWQGWKGPVRLERNGVVLVSAERASWWRSTYVVRCGEGVFDLKNVSSWRAEFALLSQGQQVGMIRIRSRRKGGAEALLPDWLPLPTRLFLLWFVTLLQRQAAASASAG